MHDAEMLNHKRTHAPFVNPSAEEIFFGELFIQQVTGILHGDTALVGRKVDQIIKLLRKIPAPPVGI